MWCLGDRYRRYLCRHRPFLAISLGVVCRALWYEFEFRFGKRDLCILCYLQNGLSIRTRTRRDRPLLRTAVLYINNPHLRYLRSGRFLGTLSCLEPDTILRVVNSAMRVQHVPCESLSLITTK